MMAPIRAALLAGLTMVVAACGTSAATTGVAGVSSPCGVPASGESTMITAGHVISVVIGPAETMYSQADAAAHHPTSGEVMMGGATMSGGNGGMGQAMMSPGSSESGTTTRHLEVHICDRSMTVTRDANP